MHKIRNGIQNATQFEVFFLNFIDVYHIKPVSNVRSMHFKEKINPN